MSVCFSVCERLPAVFLHFYPACISLQPWSWHWFGVLFKDNWALQTFVSGTFETFTVVSSLLTEVNVSDVLLLWTLPKAPVARPREEATFLVGALVSAVFIQWPPWALLSDVLWIGRQIEALSVSLDNNRTTPWEVSLINAIPFWGSTGWSGQSWHCALRGRGCRGFGRGPARADRPSQHACTPGRGRTWGNANSCQISSSWRSADVARGADE